MEEEKFDIQDAEAMGRKTKVSRKLKLNKFIKFYYFIDFSEDFDTAVEQFNRLK
jgi:hypothetical protein